MTVDINKINPDKWITLLSEAVSPLTKKTSPHKYIVVEKTNEGDNYHIQDSSKLSPNERKLSIPEIVELSKEAFAEKRESFQEGNLNTRQFVQGSVAIYNLTEWLIQAKINKHNEPLKSIGRGIALILSAVASLISVEIPFLLMIRNNDQKFKQEIDELKKNLEQQRKETIHLVQRQSIDKIPDILIELKNTVPDDKQQEQLEANLKENYETFLDEPQAKCIPLFRKDLLRGVSFKIVDMKKKIHDTEPQPPLHLRPEERVRQGIKKLEELVTPVDENWKNALQLLTNQSTLSVAFGPFIGLFNVEASAYEWREGGSSRSLKVDFSSNLPPIELKVIRDEHTGKIQKVLVTVEGTLDILAYDPTDIKKTSVVIQNAVKGMATYTLTLNPGEVVPVITDFHTHLESHIPTPK